MDKKKFDDWSLQYEKDVLLCDQKNIFPFIGYKKMIDSIVNHASAKEGNLILDLGIGTGTISKLFYEKKCKIYGLDFSDQMILFARKKMPSGYFEVIDISKNYLGSLSDKIFDFIVSGYCFHHFTDNFKVSFIKKLSKNNLKKGGKIIIGDIGFSTPENFRNGRKIYNKYWDKNEYYICGTAMVQELNKNNIKAEYIEISPCGILLIISNE